MNIFKFYIIIILGSLNKTNFTLIKLKRHFMKIEKFNTEIDTLNSFFKTYCQDNHDKQEKRNLVLMYNDKVVDLELSLCSQCYMDIKYCFDRLKQCPHEEKPKCRKCPNPCYEKTQWKKTAKVMRYSAIKLKLVEVKKRVKSFFTN